MTSEYSPNEHGISDNNTIVSISFFKNEHLRLVSIGEEHVPYNINNPNVFHEWIAEDKIATATLILEDRYDGKTNMTCQRLISRCFDPERIFWTDNIRDEFIYTCTQLYVSEYFDDTEYKGDYTDGNSYVKDFLINSHTQPIFEREYLEKYIQNHMDLHLNNIHTPKFITETYRVPGLALFIDLAGKYNNLYDISRKHVETKKLVNLIRAIKKKDDPSDSIETNFGNLVLKSVQTPVQTIIIKYELLLYQYITYNFIYRVCRWVMKYKASSSENSGIPESQYQEIIKIMISSMKLNIAWFKMISIMNRMLDYIAILKILDLYDAAKSAKKEVLVWLAAGGMHNMYINNFIIELFNMIDPFTINKSYTGAIANCLFKKTGALISDKDFSDFTNKNPQFGLSNMLGKFEIMLTSKKYMNKIHIIDILKKTIDYIYPNTPNRHELITLLSQNNIPIEVLQRLLPIAMINVPVTVNALKILSQSSEEDLQKYGLVKKSFHYGELTVHPALSILNKIVKPFSKEAYQRIKSYTIADMMAHPNNMSFRAMYDDKSILELPTQYQEEIAELNQLKQEYQLSIGPYQNIEIPIQDTDDWVKHYMPESITEPLWQKNNPSYASAIDKEKKEWEDANPGQSHYEYIAHIVQEEEEIFAKEKNNWEAANPGQNYYDYYGKEKNNWEAANPGQSYEEHCIKEREILKEATPGQTGKIEGGFDSALLLCGLAIPINILLLAVLVMVFLYLVFNISCREKCPPRYTVNYV